MIIIKTTNKIQIITKEEKYSLAYSVNSPITYIQAGITYPVTPYEIKRKISGCYSFEYVYSGTGAVQHNDKIFRVSKGDMFILHPNSFHHYYSSPKEPWKKIWIVIDGNLNFISHLMEDYKLEQTTHIPGTNSPFKLEELFNAVKSQHTNINHYLETLILEHIIEISDFCNTINATDIAPSIELARIYLENKVNTQVTLEELCNYTKLGKTYFCKLFKKAYNTSPKNYFIQLKINEAKNLLINTSMTIDEISNKLAFYDSSHFSHYFKKIVGISAGEFRKYECDKNQ